MQTEQKQKTNRIPDPLKAVIATVLFFVFAAVFIGIIILPDELIKAKDYDTVIIGSSLSRWGMVFRMPQSSPMTQPIAVAVTARISVFLTPLK